MDEQPTPEELQEFEDWRVRRTENYFSGVGKCITVWSTTEGRLVVISAILLDINYEKAGLILYSIQNIHSWLSLIDELFAMNPRFQALRSDWNAIADRLKKLNDTRVRLAHHALDRGKTIDALEEGEDLDALLPALKAKPVRHPDKVEKAISPAIRRIGHVCRTYGCAE